MPANLKYFTGKMSYLRFWVGNALLTFDGLLSLLFETILGGSGLSSLWRDLMIASRVDFTVIGGAPMVSIEVSFAFLAFLWIA